MTASAPTPANYSATIDTLVTQKFLRVNWEATKKIRVLTDVLSKRGAITYDGSAKWIEWTARVGQWSAGYHNDLAVRTFARKNHDVNYAAAWAIREIPGVLSESDIMFLSSPERLVDLKMKMLTRMSEDFLKDTNFQLLQSNGGPNTVAGISAFSGGQYPVLGLPTMFGYGTAAVGYNFATTASTGSAVAAGDKEVLPNVTYCNVSTHPTNAIAGVDNKMDGSTSPVIANFTSTAWNTASGTSWAINAQDVLEHCITRTSRSGASDETPDFGIMPQQNFLQFRQNLRGAYGAQRHVVLVDDSPRQPDVGMYARRFIPFLGVEYFYDEDCAANNIFTLNSKKLNLRVFPQKAQGTGVIGGDVDEMFIVNQMYDIDQGANKVVAKVAYQLAAFARYHALAYNAA